MFGSEVLDVAIGLVFIYLVLSLVCSAACELIESFLKRRAMFLERGLQELLNDKTDSGLVSRIYNHPLVNSLFHGNYQPGRKANLPSYIPPAMFSLALMDIIGLCGSNANAAGPVALSLPATANLTPESIRGTILANASFSPRVAQALLALADSAGYDLTKMRLNIETWYNSSMDRVSGWFKRRSHMVVLMLGFLIALAINADTISITNSLATDKALRASLTSAATEASKTPPSENSNSFQDDIQQIRSAGLPLGWTRASTDLRRMPETLPGWLMKLLGIVLTTLAISLGGPFWFDTLNRFMVVRSTVKPSEKSPDEPAKN